ncbi:LegC family aminotransferase [Campylobacter sp. CCUG 57310]|uniref:LegC family aminotransferase n=1 Tax=Campylobacter sp. CCUG 57310 TaxID=2517362 RepID=UPI001566FB69|nr:LegC family aminotransferase [Campylobacter sp. CCUG 57310]QKF91982.1 aminotransferase, DegT/DnrJ/EryC1/StrS family [Campylobacter sp. CCUG 57310]
MKTKFDEILAFIRSTFQSDDFIPLHEPKFIGNEKRYLNECIDSGFVSSVGKFVEVFEQKLAYFTGAKYAIATSNGTSALHAALIVAGVKECDEVITQPLSFVATANAIRYCGARPIFLDVSLENLGLSVESLEKFLAQNCELKNGFCVNRATKNIVRACVPMHTFGLMCDISAIKEICEKWHIVLVEDAAESLGSYFKGIHSGNFGILGAFSFNGNKVITSGGGGAIITNDENLACLAKHITTTAKVPHAYEYVHDMVGFNYRMPNLNAALLVAQLENLELFLNLKRKLHETYTKFFAKFDGVRLIGEMDGAYSNYWLNALLFDDPKDKAEFLEISNINGVMTRPIWRLLSELDMFKTFQTDELTNAKFLQERIVNIPSSVIV